MFKEAAASVVNFFRPLASWWSSRGPAERDALFAAGLIAVSFVPELERYGIFFGELSLRDADTTHALLILGQALPLAVRRRFPAATLAVTAAAFAADQILGYPSTPAALGLLIVLYGAGADLERFRRVTAAVASAAYVGVAVALHQQGSREELLEYVTFYFFLTLWWGAGFWMRARQATEAEQSRRDAESAVHEERARIARELHDVVTHHVTAMVVQADAAQFLVPSEPERVTEGLVAIGETGRRALTDLRQLLGVLDAGDGETSEVPAPDLDLLADLVEHTRTVGQPVELHQEGERRRLPGGTEAAAFRVVQEGLTNAVKYAGGNRTVVWLRYGADELGVEVTTEGSAGGRAPSVTGGGRGLAGLRERVSLLGGHLTAGARPEGGFTVHARVPLDDAGA